MARHWKTLTFVALPVIVLASTSVTGRTAGPPPPIGFGSLVDLGPSGGEPSIQDDGRGHVYVTGPTGIPAIANNTTGVQFWRSTNGGSSFEAVQNVGSSLGGGDSDVTADQSGNLWITDLEAAAANVQLSPAPNYGAPGSFSNLGNGNITLSNQAGPDDDREWLTPSGTSLYFTYHDFANNVPLIFKSTSPTTNPIVFAPGGSIFGGNATFAADANGDTLVSKPVVDSAGDIFVLTNTSTQSQNSTSVPINSGPLDRLYLSESIDGGASFTASLINDISNGGTNSGSWGHVFNQMAIDAAGNIYIAAAGTTTAPVAGSPNGHIYLIRGLKQNNGSYSWQPAIPVVGTVSNPDLFAETFPAIAVGQAGAVAVGYYKTQPVAGTCAATCYQDFHNDSNKFQFFVSETLNATDLVPAPAWTETQVTTTSPHPAGICTDGIFCGTAPPLWHGGNRNLADFESMTVDPTGNLELVIPADSDGTNTHNWYWKQTSGPLLTPGLTNGNGTGNQTYVFSPTNATPEAPWVVLLPLAGAGAVAVAVRRRRRSLTASG